MKSTIQLCNLYKVFHQKEFFLERPRQHKLLHRPHYDVYNKMAYTPPAL
jgi:hypothetical protein